MTETIGFINYAITLWLVSGILILVLDVKSYEFAAMYKEKKIARVLGWFNIIFGILSFVGLWAYRTWV
jgi:uncharacterized protein with PQ loop repeat